MKKLFYLLSLVIPISGCASDKPKGAVVSYEYIHRECMAFPRVYYLVSADADGKQTLTYSKDDGVQHTVALQEDVLGKIGAIAKSHKLHRLKDHYTPPFQILDGYSWTLYIRYESGSVSSSGTNARPSKKLKEGIEAINDYLESFLPEDDN